MKLSEKIKRLAKTAGAEEEVMAVEAVSPKCEEAKVNFFEIPLHMAVNLEKREASAMLEEMDAVIYITSALMPFTASDAAYMAVIMNLFPMILYVSKADILDNEDYIEATEYIRESFAAGFEGAVMEIIDSRRPDGADIILKGIRELPLEEIREFHLVRLEQQAKAAIADKLRRGLERLDVEKKERERDKAAKNAAWRERQLEWEELRLGMLERKQGAVDIVNKRVKSAEKKSVEKLEEQLAQTLHKKKWVEQELKTALKKQLEYFAQNVMEDLRGRAEADAAWLAAEAEKKCGSRIHVEHMEGQREALPGEKEDYRVGTPGCSRLIAAAGSGFLAGGALFSSLPLFPACMIAIPASVAMLCFLKGNMDDQEQYHENLRRLIGECCEKNFAAAAEQMRAAVNTYYDAMAAELQSMDCREGTEEGFEEDLEARRKEFTVMLAELEKENWLIGKE